MGIIMRKNSAAEAILSKYSDQKNAPKERNTASRYPKKSDGGTLSDFYREVYAANTENGKHPYQNKNASEIEFMMMSNRRLIETARSKRV